MVSNAEASAIDKKIAEKYVELFKADSDNDSRLDPIYRMFRITRRSYPDGEDVVQKAIDFLDNTEGISDRKVETLNNAINKYQEGKDKVMALLFEYRKMEDTLYTGWNRFYYVNNGHIHNSMSCGTCNKRGIATRFTWLPDLSGLTEKEAVEAHGAILCTVCFPSAPIEWTNGSTKKDDDVCPGSGTSRWAKGRPERANAAVSAGGTCGVCGQFAGIRSRSDHGIRKHRLPYIYIQGVKTAIKC